MIRYGSNPHQIESWLPTDRVTLWGDVGITVDRLILLAIGSASAFGLWLLYRSSQFGLATEAVSESERSAAAIGLSPNRIALLNWALGSAHRRRRRHPRRADHHPAGDGDDGADPRRDGRGAGRRLPVVPDRHRRRVRDRHRPGAGRTVRQPGGPRTVAAVPRDHRGARVPRAARCRCATTTCSSCR